MQSTGLTFRVFVSSTFNDLKAERNALQEQVFPRLRDLCASHGARFQAIDLRWGVSEEASLDQQAMPICLAEIQRCQRVTPRPNFVVLLGDRYGWRPLPAEIPASEFEPIRQRVATDPADDALAEESGQGALTLLDAWYRRDDNAVPPVYILQPREGEFERYEIWDARVERPLRAILRQAIQGLGLSPEVLLKYEASATHQEIERGALQVPDANQHVHCFFRAIQGLPANESAKDYRDLVDGQPDAEAEAALQALKALLRKRLPGNVHEYVAVWREGQVSSDHLKEMCDQVYAALAGVIRQQIAAWKESPPPEQEVATQAAFLAERAADFTGRAGDLRTIADYLDGSASHPLAILGAPGSGKSALLAHVIQEAQKARPDALSIFRFVGVTPGSSNGQSLLHGLCEQLYERLGLAAHKQGRLAAIHEVDEAKREKARAAVEAEYAIPEDLAGLSETLRRFLAWAPASRRLFLFLDALDQLDLLDPTRRLAWLPTQLPTNVRLVVTVATDAEDLVRAFHTRLRGAQPHTLAPMSRQEGDLLLHRWMAKAGRALQEAQEVDILDKFAPRGLPLYLRLAFDEARRWRSYDGLPGGAGLGVDIPGVIADQFARLSRESQHGQTLVSRSLGYLAASRYGLAEDELLDVLSADVPVMRDFRRRSPKSPEVSQLPAVVWLRLYHDLEPYLAQRSADGTPVLGFYHRQLREGAERRYLSSADERRERHAALAACFESRWRRPDAHALSELPYHQATAGQGQAYRRTLLTYAFLRAKVETLGIQRLLADYDVAQALSLLLGPEDGTALRLVAAALGMLAHTLRRDPRHLPSQLTGRLLGRAEGEIQALLADIRRETTTPWLRPLSASLTPPGGPLRRTLTGHTGSVRAVAVTADGRLAVSGSKDKTLRVWNLETGECLRTLTGHAGEVTAVAVTPDGRAVSGSEDKTLRVWDLETGECLRTLTGHTRSVSDVAVTPDGRAVSGSQDQTLRVWNLETGECLRTLTGHTGWVEVVAVTPDGQRAMSGAGAGDLTLRVWNLATGECLRTLTQNVNAVALTADGKRAVLPERYAHTLVVRDLETGECLRTLTGHTGEVKAVAVTPDGRAVSGSDDQTLRVWDLETGECLHTLRGHTQPVWAVAVTPDGRWAVSGSHLELRVWDLAAECSRTLSGHTSEVWAVAVTPDGRLAVSGSGDQTLRVWDLATGECLRTLTGHTFTVWAVAVTADGRRAVSGSGDCTLRVWDLETGECLRTLTRRMGILGAVAITPDERAVSGSEDGTLRVRNLATGGHLRGQEGHEGYVGAVAITPDGRAVSGSEDGTLRVWNLATGEHLCRLEGHKLHVTAMAVTADWRWAVSGLEDKTVRVWDLETGQCVRTLAGHTDSVSGLAVTADGRLVVSASADGTLRVWNLGRGKCLRILKGHMDWVSAVAVTADGQRAVSGSKDKTVRVWNLETGECVRTLTGHTDWVDVVTLAADGRRVVTESDLELKVWDVETGVCLCTLAGHTALMDRMVRRCCGGDLLRTLAGYTGVKRPVALSADGRCGVLRSDDKTLRVWDLAAGALLASFEGAGAMAVFAATPDGCTLVGGDEDGSVHLLRLENVEPGPTHITATRLWRSGVEWDTELSAACPRCGQRFAVSRALLGTETACPHCAGALRVNPLAYDPDPALLAPDIPAEQPSPVTRTAAAPYVICRADLERVAYGWLAIPLAVAAVAWGLTRLTPRLWLCAGPLLIQAALAVLSLLVVRWGSCPSCRQPLVVLPGQHRVKCFACQTKIQVIG